MPADRLLTTVLKAYQDSADATQTDRILSSTASLLTTLSNPLNITLLTSHFLAAPAVWNQVDGLKTSLRIIGIFNTAAITVRRYYQERGAKPYDAYQPRLGGGLSCDEWAKAVVKGADNRSPRWIHTLVIGGLLLGMEGQDRRGLSSALRMKAEYALVSAINLSMIDPATSEFGANSVVLVLNHTFPLLSDSAKSEINFDSLVMTMIRAMISTEGYQDAYFIETIDSDISQISVNKFDWSPQSSSFLQLQRLASAPLVASMGPLSRLIAHAIENLKDSSIVLDVRDHLLAFTESISARWRRNKLSEIDTSEEITFLSAETLGVTYPALWQVLRTVMFATVAVFRAIIGRTLIDPLLATPLNAPKTALKSLLVLRNLHFISSRLGSNALSIYTFVNMSSIDILSRFPKDALAFFRSIHPPHAGQIPAHPLDRNLDLFYLNTAEHFTLTLSATESESLIATTAAPYLNPTANPHLLPIFEAAHSAMLAVLGAPENAPLTAKILPFYVDSLFNSFPTNLSPRQFRFAFKSLMQISTPPGRLSASEPLMAETLLELLHYRGMHASTAPLPPSLAIRSEADVQSQQPMSQLSEQSVLLLTMLDAFPNVTLNVLEDWLPIAAELLNVIDDSEMREHCKQRFWELLISGEMDVERSAVCVAWWSTRNGREQVLFGRKDSPQPMMSGALGVRDGSRL